MTVSILVILALLTVIASLVGAISIYILTAVIKLTGKINSLGSTESDKISNIDEKLNHMQDMLATMFDEINMAESNQSQRAIFRSMDGKYEASSIEELLEKMASGGDLVLNNEDGDRLQDFFKQLIQSIEVVDLEYEDDSAPPFFVDDDEEGNEKWK